ncbi:MAG: hypothetical protein HYY93_13020 [Planctomycetes bacterium]|nr:hypothetical protein [Planctomycetota bacterium]
MVVRKITRVEQSFEEFIASLNSNGARYLIVGAFAFSYHARPRYTKDIDFWVEPSPENALRVLRAIRDFGYKTLDVDEAILEKRGQVLILGVAPVRIDVITSISAVSFGSAWRNRSVGRYGGQKAWFLGRRELLRNKRAVGRPQDLADVDVLLRIARRSRRRHS